MSDAKKRGLGRGLGALLPNTPPAAWQGGPHGSSAQPVVAGTAHEREKSRVYFAAGIEELYPSPEQPRRLFDTAKLDELADSIRAHGIIVPLVVRPRPEGGYYLIAGERRWRAAQRAGTTELPVVVRDVAEGEALERALVENLQRADLGPLEEAAAFQRLSDEFGLTQDEIGARIGKDRSTVANTMRLLKLPLPVRQLVEDDKLTMGHARALLSFENTEDMEIAARKVVAKALSVRATEDLVKRTKEPSMAKADRPVAKAPSKSASVRDLEDRLTRSLGGPVSITEDAPGKAGTLEIRYMDLDHLERLLDRLL